MFGKSSQWWFGKNSIFGQAIRQTKYGADQGSYTQYINGSSQFGEAELLKYGVILGAFILLFKK